MEQVLKNALSGLSIFCLFLVASHSTYAAIHEFESKLVHIYSSGNYCFWCDPPQHLPDSGALASTGDSVYVTLDYDSTQIGDYGDHYNNMGISLSLGGRTFGYDSDSEGYCSAGLVDGGVRTGDEITINCHELGDSNDGWDSHYSLYFFDQTGTALDDSVHGVVGLHMPNELELNAFSSASLTFARWFKQDGNYTGSQYFTAYAPLPLPPVIYLFISGIIGLLGFARYRAAN